MKTKYYIINYATHWLTDVSPIKIDWRDFGNPMQFKTKKEAIEVAKELQALSNKENWINSREDVITIDRYINNEWFSGINF